MNHFISQCLLSSISLLLVCWSANAGGQIADCDIPGRATKAVTLESATACMKQCQSDPSCQAISFVSGWNRCFLKAAFSREVVVRFYSGEKHGSELRLEAYDVDYSGKDFSHIPHVISGKACGEKCLESKRCAAYTYLTGYNDCYLKLAIGRRREKKFWCWHKAPKTKN